MTDPEPQPAASPPSAGFNPTGSVAAGSNAHLIAPVGLVIAGLLGLIGGLLPWVSFTVSAPGGGVSSSVQGSSLSAGPNGTESGAAIAVVLGTLILLSAAGFLFGRRNRILPATTAVLSLALLGFAVFKIIDVYRQANDFYNRMDQLVQTIPGPLPPGFPNLRDVFHIDPAPGLWMVALSGLLGIVLSMVILWRTKRLVSEAVRGPALPQPSPSTPTRFEPDVVPGAWAPAAGAEQPTQPDFPADDPAQNWGAPAPIAPPIRPEAPPDQAPSGDPASQ